MVVVELRVKTDLVDIELVEVGDVRVDVLEDEMLDADDLDVLVVDDDLDVLDLELREDVVDVLVDAVVGDVELYVEWDVVVVAELPLETE
eukprot:6291667-Amphidinium_carterae.1